MSKQKEIVVAVLEDDRIDAETTKAFIRGTTQPNHVDMARELGYSAEEIMAALNEFPLV